MRFKIYPYLQGSRSARALADTLGGHVLYTDARSRYRARPEDMVINWGSTSAPLQFRDRSPGLFLNHPDIVAVAADKLRLFQTSLGWDDAEVREVIVPWTTDPDEAYGWLQDDASSMVCVRQDVRSRGGQGLVIVDYDDRDTLVTTYRNAPLFTKYIKKIGEYRIHLAKSGDEHVYYEIFDKQMKRRRRDLDDDDVNFQVRSHNNGWVFCREDIEVPAACVQAADLIMNNLGLDFGAVDVVYNAHYEKAYVLEVNTAPGLEGTTLDRYADMIRARAR